MDKLEQYLDQVCRGLGGSRAMRHHVRQELREHLRDAVAEHRAAGMSEDDALARALEDFGGPEQVRTELEATHGHRLMAVVIDKAIAWKEKTMKAKWLWTSWAHFTLFIVIAMEVFSLWFTKLYLVPKFEKIASDGFLPGAIEDPEVSFLFGWLRPLNWLAGHATWVVLAFAALWGLFEWRVKSENKTLMRFAALGTTAIGFVVTLLLALGAMLLMFFLGLPAGILVGPQAVQDVTACIESSVDAIDRERGKKELRAADWEAIQTHAARATHAMDTLSRLKTQHRKWSLGQLPEAKATELWGQMSSAKDHLTEAQAAAQAKDGDRLNAALQEWREKFRPVREWSKGLVK